MEHSWVEKVVIGLVTLGVVIIGVLRLGMGTAAVAGLGHIPMSMIPARLRRFLFGERNDPAHKPHN
jgi:hypothetical protein